MVSSKLLFAKTKHAEQSSFVFVAECGFGDLDIALGGDGRFSFGWSWTAC